MFFIPFAVSCEFLFLVLVTCTSNSFTTYLIRGEFFSVVSIAPLYHRNGGYDVLFLLKKVDDL